MERECPKCHRKISKKFLQHLSKCGVSLKDYILITDNLSEIPKCPICGTECSIRGYHYNECCCRSHHISLNHKRSVENGTYNWLAKNLKRDENGKSITHIISTQNKIKNKTHNMMYTGNKERDLKLFELKSKIQQDRIKSGNHNFTYNGDPNHDEKVRKLHHNSGVTSMRLMTRPGQEGKHSYPEDLLGELLDKLNFKYLREYHLLNGKYRADYFIESLNLIIECDGMFKFSSNELKSYWSTRKKEIEELTNYKVINIKSNDVFYYVHHLDELRNLINTTSDQSSP